jgi:hypothetical protein
VLALLNSRVLDYFIKQTSTPFSGGYFAFSRQYIEPLPIRPIDFALPSERARHDAIEALANRILKAKQANTAADTSVLERGIDERVYRLYGLTSDEIRLVEESTSSPGQSPESVPDSPAFP